MCPQQDNESNIHALNQLQALRLAGELGPALQAATRAMAQRPTDMAIMAEAIRVLILSAQTETAVRLYQAFTDNTLANNNLEPEALVRMALQLGRTDLLADMPTPAGPSWLVTLLGSGEDPLKPLVLQEMQVKVANGPSDYNFTSACPHCDHGGVVRISTNLLVYQTGLCPACFGGYVIDYEDIRAFIRQRHKGLLTADIAATDWDLIDHIRPRLMEKGAAPEIVQNLGQEYHFILNEILARHLMESSS